MMSHISYWGTSCLIRCADGSRSVRSWGGSIMLLSGMITTNVFLMQAITYMTSNQKALS